MKEYDIVIIGGGPAGLAAAVSARDNGIESILILERDRELGGILNQCIHNGFGLHTFKEELTGPEYAARYEEQVFRRGIEYKLNTMVMDISHDKVVTAMNREEGLFEIQAKAVILAMGCRERSRGALNIPGYRPAGIFSAGTAQRLVNMEGFMPGREVVILGSGDIGMIMARRMSLEGAKVLAVVEIMDYLAGLTRNKVQCLDDFNIPLKLSHTITRIAGDQRVEGVYVARVDENRKPVKETEEYIACDTLLLSVGLIPENELTRKADITISDITSGPEVNQYMQTSVPSVFACGNVVHVNDLVDNVTVESMLAGQYAALYAAGKLEQKQEVRTRTGTNVRYICPQRLMPCDDGQARLFFRVLAPDMDVRIEARCNGKVIASKKERRVNPGEMCSIKIPLSEVDSDIVVDVIKEA